MRHALYSFGISMELTNDRSGAESCSGDGFKYGALPAQQIFFGLLH